MVLLIGFIVGFIPAYNWGGWNGAMAWFAVNAIINHYWVNGK